MLGRLGLDVARLVRQVRARRMDPLALGLEHPRHRVLGQPVDLEVRQQRPQLPAIATSRCAWPSPIGEEMYSARLRRAAARASSAEVGVRRRSMKSRSSRLTFTGSRACGQWPEPSRRAPACRPVSSASAAPESWGRIGVVGPVDDQHRATTRRTAQTDVASSAAVRRAGVATQCLGIGLQRPADRILALLGRVRLGEHLREEELHEVRVVREPVVAIPLPPALVVSRGSSNAARRSRAGAPAATARQGR